VDESYFGGVRKGKHGRGAAGKVPVFGILKRGGKVYTKMIADASSKTLLKVLKSKVLPGSIVYTDSFGSYDVLDVSGFKHRRVNRSKTFVSPKIYYSYVLNSRRFNVVRAFIGVATVLFASRTSRAARATNSALDLASRPLS